MERKQYAVADVTIANWHLSQSAAKPIRFAVFVAEQHVPVELEWDEMDAVSLHAIARDANGAPIGTGRLLPDGHIGRMAVVSPQRGRGVGSSILAVLMREARQRGDVSVVLHAQRSAENFYRRHGFQPEGEPFIEAGIEHIAMRHRFAADLAY